MTTRLVIAIVFALAVAQSFAASEQAGQVTFSGLPVPGATVTATQGTRTVVATTDQQGLYQDRKSVV